MIDSTVTDTDGVYTCSVTNARGYDNGVTGMGGKAFLYSLTQARLTIIYVCINERFMVVR
jgi:hypothetical protein